jgi:hypothetical protein
MPIVDRSIERRDRQLHGQAPPGLEPGTRERVVPDTYTFRIHPFGVDPKKPDLRNFNRLLPPHYDPFASLYTYELPSSAYRPL